MARSQEKKLEDLFVFIHERILEHHPGTGFELEANMGTASLRVKVYQPFNDETKPAPSAETSVSIEEIIKEKHWDEYLSVKMTVGGSLEILKQKKIPDDLYKTIDNYLKAMGFTFINYDAANPDHTGLWRRES